MNDKEWSPFRTYVKKRGCWAWQDAVFILSIILFSIFVHVRASKLSGYDWNWELLAQFIVIEDKNGHYQAGVMLNGLFTTLRIGFWTILFSFSTGGLLGLFCARASTAATILFQTYINIVRNTPPLVFLFCVYFFASNILPVSALEHYVRQLPPFWNSLIALVFAPHGQLDRMIAAILALGLYQGAYIAEIMRAGIESVPQGQWDAARALGFPTWQTMFFIILPQASKLTIPPLTGQAITTFKDSALASLISLPDLTFQSLEIMAVSNMTFEIWLTSAILYFLIGIICAFVGKKLEKHYSSFIS